MREGEEEGRARLQLGRMKGKQQPANRAQSSHRRRGSSSSRARRRKTNPKASQNGLDEARLGPLSQSRGAGPSAAV